MTIARVIATIAAAATLAAPHKADAGCKTRRCKARVTHRECSQSKPRACVLHVIYHQRISGWRRAWLLRIPGCESGWNPYAYFQHPLNTTPVTAYVTRNDISAGLFEFKPTTWAGTPYARRSIWAARWQAYAAAWMLRNGRVGEWACV